MSRVRTSSGHILAVQSRLLGSALDGGHTAGVTSLTVQDCADFDDDLGGSLILNGATYVYSDVDDDAGTLAISPALAADADDGDEVTILDPILGSPQYTVTASVTEDGEDPGDPIEADVASGIAEQLPEGVRGLAGEAVTITWDEDDDPTVTGLVGINNNQAGFVRGFQDSHVASSPSDLSFDLTYQPTPNSTIHLYWNGVLQEDAAWSIDGWTITVSDPDGLVVVNDRFYVKYLYKDPTPSPTPPAPPTYDEIMAGGLTVLGRWDLDDTTGTTIHATLGPDGSSSGLTPVTLGASGLVDDGGTAISTDWNEHQSLSTPLTGLAPSPTAPGWLAVWFKWGGSSNPFSTRVFRDATGATGLGYLLDLTGTNVVVRVNGTDHTVTSVTSASLLDGGTHMAFLVEDADDVALILDGALVDSWTQTGSNFWINVTSPIFFGRNNTSGQYSSFTYDRIAVGSDSIADVEAVAADLWDRRVV